MKASSALSRRAFLMRTTGSLALASAGPFSLTRHAGGAEVGSANNAIQIGFIGMGRQAGDLMRVLVGLKEARVVAIADVNLPRAEGVARAHNARAFQDYRRLLELKEVDAVITATPEHWRGRICIHTCQAGKDLYVEKPMSLTIHEGRHIVRAVRTHKRVCQTGSQQRSMWPNFAGCRFIREGGLGKITRVIAHNYPSPWEGALPAGTMPNGIDWEMWCGAAPSVPFHPDLYAPRANPGWLSFRPYSGGEMTGWGSHGFDQVQCALNMDQSGPLEMWTEGGTFHPPTYTAPEPKARGDQLCSIPKVYFRYAGDIIMELGKGPPGGAIFMGEKGTATIDRAVFRTDPPALAGDTLENRPAGFRENHLRNWLECIRTRERPIADVEVGHRSATVCHLGNIVRRLGRRLRWDPAEEHFLNDAEANGQLDRERRKGYELPAV